MLGRQHLAIAVFLIFLVFILNVGTMQDDGGKSITELHNIINGGAIHPIVAMIFILIMLGLFVLGSVLPDADSEDSGSFIYHTKYSIIASILKIVEHPIAFILKRPTGHRQSLHTILGIFISSVLISGVVYYIYGMFYLEQPFKLLTFFLLFLPLFLGQILHVICDWHFELR